MSLQWTLIAGILYAEIFLCTLMLLPFVSAYRWNRIFKAKIFAVIEPKAKLFFQFTLGILAVIFADSFRDIRKYSQPVSEIDHLRNNPTSEAVMYMKLFRSQRNCYIAGFSLFLFMVLGRLVVLLSRQAKLEAEAEATKKQAESASAQAKRLLDEASNEDKKAASAVEELSKAKEELRKANTDMSAMKKQSESLAKEYDRLSSEYASLQNKMKVGGKKDS